MYKKVNPTQSVEGHAIALARLAVEMSELNPANLMDQLKLVTMLGTAKVFGEIILKKAQVPMPWPDDDNGDKGA